MTTAPLTPPKLSEFHRTVLELIAQADTESEAIQYIQDWQKNLDNRCNRAKAKSYIIQAQAQAKRIEEFST